MNIAFETKLPADPQKLRGGYYTPRPVAEFLVRWAVRTGRERVLEPSCGDGNFILPLAERIRALVPQARATAAARVVAVEVEPSELAKAQLRLASTPAARVPMEWIGDDFFRAYPVLRDPGFDVVVGNPPFIRFQHFREESRSTAFEHLRAADYRPTKLANAWAAFVQLSVELLRPGGRLAMVIPAELLQVQYAAELRSRLVATFDHLIIVGFRRLIFPEIQQEVVLLMAEGKRAAIGDECEIHTIDITDASDLDDAVFANRIAHTAARHARAGMKWTALYLTDQAFAAIDHAENHEALSRLGTLAEVDVGIVTGLNSFFVIDEERSQAIGAENYTVPLVGKTAALKGIRFGPEDFRAFRRSFPSRLLNFNGILLTRLPDELRAYIASGEDKDAHTGYKCRIRKRWVDVPSIYVPDAFLFRQIHAYPLLVINEANATSTDTIHRVRLNADVDGRLLSACFVNSLTFAWSEVSGRSYGGGVLELEPREAEDLPVPYFPDLDLDPGEVDALVRQGLIEAALDLVDAATLVGRLGFTPAETAAMRTAWRELSGRRINRR